ncbi:interleukin-1 receptor type 1-like [Archocentrus centrarchus]|uniref:interleukin-1 receptor type 1-like n=1 Tax=Archocentrus centrarchus TaxID=63155 RepID=UPI0011EA3E86|nr:interleukin-1 receptor type 1-like [Archocentrus centrarchus]XP_030578731.1 interleukin-1 receptor type 1-like [Archocentrus centrarchus]
MDAGPGLVGWPPLRGSGCGVWGPGAWDCPTPCWVPPYTGGAQLCLGMLMLLGCVALVVQRTARVFWYHRHKIVCLFLCWFLSSRTPSHCYRQAAKLVVEERLPGECGRPRKALQELTKGANDSLSCPLGDHINKLRSYNITSSIKWYRDCEPIEDGTNIYEYWDTKLKMNHVELQHKGTYTCTLTFTLDGIKGSVSETIDATVTEEYSLIPHVHEPTNEVVKAQRGFNFSKRCLVFVPGDGKPSVDILWLAREDFIETNTSHRVHMLDQRMLPNDGPINIFI